MTPTSPVCHGATPTSHKAVDEIVDVRVWSGLHFRSADEQAARIGKQVAKYRDMHYFRSLH